MLKNTTAALAVCKAQKDLFENGRPIIKTYAYLSV